MVTYSDYAEEDLNKDILLQDNDFLLDASSFLAKRKNLDLTDPEEIYDEFISHMRQSDVNELDTIGDLMYAQEAESLDKEEMRRLYDAYDKMPIELTEDIGGKIMDYGEGLLTAPSTYLGVMTGGGAKVGAVTAMQAAKVGTKEILKRGMLSGATKAMLVEGGIGAVQGGLSEGVRVEVSPDREFTGEGILVGGIAGAVPGVVIGGTTGYVTTRNAVKAADTQRKALQAADEIRKKAETNADEVIKKNADKASTKKVEEILRPIDPDLIAQGEADRTLMPAEITVARLDDSVRKRVTGAVVDIIGDVKPKDGERITETIVRVLRDSPDAQKNIQDVLLKYNISGEQLGNVFAADISSFGRGLQEVGQVKKLIKNTLDVVNDTGVRINESALEPVVNEGKVFRAIKDQAGGFEKMRRAVLTSQIQTTVRNFAGGGLRVFLDTAENFLEDKTMRVAKKLGYDYTPEQFRPDSLAIAKYLFNQEEAEMVVNMYRRNNPEAADRIFKTFIDATDLSEQVGTQTRMEAFGLKINFLNKMSDNYYKKAIFAGHLQRLVKAKYGKDLIKILEEGKFDSIDPKLFDEAGNKAFELLYQLTPSGKGEGLTGFLSGTAKNYLQKVDTLPGLNMVTGAIMPFPRFVINQIQFMYEHAPVIGMLNATKETMPKKIGQQVTGVGLIMGGMAIRAQEGTDMEWYEITNEEGKKIDLRPLLGPFNMFMYLGDIAYRKMTGQEYKDDYMAEIGEMAVGSSLRAGTGKYMLEQFGPEAMASLEGESDMSLKAERFSGRMIGDYFATLSYAMPIAVARDLFKLTDEEARVIPETNGEVTFADIALLRSTRALPEPVREYFAGEKKERYSITTPTPTKTQDPIGTMVSGAGKQAPSTEIEKELARLKMDSYDLYKPIPFGPADVAVRREVSQVLARSAMDLFDSSRYKNAKGGDPERRMLLKNLATEVITRSRSNVFDGLRKQAEAGQIDQDVDTINQFEFESLNPDMRRSVRTRFEQEYGRTLGGDAYQANDYALALRIANNLKETLRPSQFAEGGMVGDPLSLSETLEEEDTVARKEAGDSYVDEMISLGLDMAPVTGEIRSAQGAVEDFEEGNYGMAALGALGALPGVGIVGRGAKAGIKALRTVDKAEDIAEAKKILGDEDAIQAWKDTNRLPESQRQKRNPIVQQAAQDLKDGNITGKEYRKIAKAEMPMRPITRENFPEMPTLKEIVGALNKDKSEKGIVGLNVDIPDGTRIGSRLDIPAYDNYDTWIVSLHDGTVRNGKAMGYGQTAVLDNVEFFTEGQGALNIATKKPKAPIARIHGDYKNEDPEAVYNRVYELMDDPEWTQVGMNPFRHSFFYDKATGNPVTRADQVLQVGPLVLAKGARSELSDLKKLKIKSADGKTRVFNEGGLMSPRKLFDGGFIRSARDFYEEEGIIPKKEKEETSTFPSFEEMMNAEDITKDMTDFQREVYEASDLTPEKSKQILEAFPEYSDRILSNTSEGNRDNALYALSEYKRILERSAYGDSDKGLMARK